MRPGVARLPGYFLSRSLQLRRRPRKWLGSKSRGADAPAAAGRQPCCSMASILSRAAGDSAASTSCHWPLSTSSACGNSRLLKVQTLETNKSEDGLNVLHLPRSTSSAGGRWCTT